MAYSPNSFAKLRDLCEILHALMYQNQDLAKAREMLAELEEVLFEASAEIGAIITTEGFAIFHELRNEFNLALSYRQREVELMNQLYQEIRNNSFDDYTKQMLLGGRDLDTLAVREAIIHSLEQKCKGADLPQK